MCSGFCWKFTSGLYSQIRRCIRHPSALNSLSGVLSWCTSHLSLFFVFVLVSPLLDYFYRKKSLQTILLLDYLIQHQTRGAQCTKTFSSWAFRVWNGYISFEFRYFQNHSFHRLKLLQSRQAHVRRYCSRSLNDLSCYHRVLSFVVICSLRHYQKGLCCSLLGGCCWMTSTVTWGIHYCFDSYSTKLQSLKHQWRMRMIGCLIFYVHNILSSLSTSFSHFALASFHAPTRSVGTMLDFERCQREELWLALKPIFCSLLAYDWILGYKRLELGRRWFRFENFFVLGLETGQSCSLSCLPA